MKKLGFIVTLLLICTFVGFSTNSTTSSAKVSISKARKQCSSYKKARKHMKKITFKVWDLKGSKKVTRTKSIYIHKSIASKVKKAFNKIYHGKEKFPIHDVGGFDWRGSNKSLHSLGLAVDINANENYMVDHGKVLAGSFWKTGQKSIFDQEKQRCQKIYENHRIQTVYLGKPQGLYAFFCRRLLISPLKIS